MLNNNNAESNLNNRNYATPVILILSVVITIVSVLYILSHLCLPFGCGEGNLLDNLAFYGALNPFVLFPLAYYFAAHHFGRGYKTSKIAIAVYIVLAFIAASPILYILSENVSSSIGAKIDQENQAKGREEQTKQIAIAKQASITLDAGEATLTLLQQPNEKLDEYNLNIPLTISNLPEDLQSYNIGCLAIEISENVLADANKFHPECANLMARKVDGKWTYKTYQWSWQEYIITQTASDKLEINAHFTSSRNVPLPNFTLAHVNLYIPFDFNQYSSPNPGGLSIESSTIIDKRIPLIINKKTAR